MKCIKCGSEIEHNKATKTEAKNGSQLAKKLIELEKQHIKYCDDCFKGIVKESNK